MKSSSGYPVNSLTSQNTKMETSTEKQVPLSNRSCNLPSKAVKRVDEFQQTSQPETFSNLGLVSELNLIVTKDTSCQTDFQSEIGRPRFSLFYKIFMIVLITTSLLIATIKLIKFLWKISTLLMKNLKLFPTNQIKLMKRAIIIITTIRRQLLKQKMNNL